MVWLVVRIVLRVLGVLLAGVASVEACFAMCFRLEGSDELRMIERLDLDLGAVFAFAFVLVFVPSSLKAPRAWLLTAGGAALMWMCVSGSLIWSHREQYRIRSTPSIPRSIED
jgi:hypothetical protein